MGWADCGTDDDERPIGYGVAATCDEPGCDAEIDRGLSYVCGSMHGGGEHGCGRYFCGAHLLHVRGEGETLESLCRDCAAEYDREHPVDPYEGMCEPGHHRWKHFLVNTPDTYEHDAHCEVCGCNHDPRED